jgi:hypothetical protein
LKSHQQKEERYDIVIRRRVEIPLSEGGELRSHYQKEESLGPIIRRRRVDIPSSEGGELRSRHQEES